MAATLSTLGGLCSIGHSNGSSPAPTPRLGARPPTLAEPQPDETQAQPTQSGRIPEPSVSLSGGKPPPDTEAQSVEPIAGGEPVTEGRTEVPRFVAPGTAAYHTLAEVST